MSARHDPAAARDAEAAGGDSAWLDTAPAGASAWDDLSDGDASAWAGPESSASVPSLRVSMRRMSMRTDA
jgi:hypothetical protein